MELREKIIGGIRVLEAILFKINNIISVEFAVTYRCNLHCEYCGFTMMPNYINAEQKSIGKEMSTQEIKEIFRILNKLNVQRINISGGEPLIRDDIDKILEKASFYKFKITLTTNGILVPEHLNILKNIDFLIISIDGDKNTNDTLKGRGSYDFALQAIDSSCKKGIKILISAVITSLTTEKDLLFLLKLCNFYSTFCVLQPVVNRVFFKKPCKIDEKIDKFIPTIEQLKYLLLYLKNSPHKKRIIGGDNYFKFILDFYKNGPDVLINCMAGRLFLFIEPDGSVHPCSMRYQELFGEKIQKCSLKEIKKRKVDLIKCAGCSCYSYVMLNSFARFDLKNIIYFLHNNYI